MRAFLILTTFVSAIVLSGCSTRQVQDQLSGSTAQRLVTHSVNKLISELPTSPLDELEGQRIWVDTHFIKNDPIVDYATARLKAEITKRHTITWAETREDAQRIVDVFFTSLGTDQDSFGLSLPVPTVTTESNDIGRIDLLAFNMYHGVSEMYFYVKNVAERKIVQSPTSKARIRTDKLALPIITIPLKTLD